MTERSFPLSPAPPAAPAPSIQAEVRAEERAARERRALVSEFVRVGEQERRRIAEGIHDDSIQVIAAMGMRLQMLRRALRDPDQLGMLADAELAVQLSIARLRNLVFELHPPGLEQEGLSVALAIALDLAGRDAGATYRLDDQLLAQPSGEVCASLFRIAQEALTNVRQHAQASSVIVTVLERDGGHAVRVADDGCGFEPELAEAGSADAGFARMRARAELGGGSVRIDSAVGSGTAVEAWLPRTARHLRDCDAA
jgi:signal transduction histidine kinase